MKIVITGFMGSGKTSVAREVAAYLDVPMLDLDEVITVSEGRSPAKLILEEGEQSFRVVESLALHELLKLHDTDYAVVIALGGGAWIEETNRALIHQYRYESVWLDAPFELCWNRIEASGDDRPLGRTKEQARALYERRRPIYQLANLQVPVLTNDSFDDVVARIIDYIRIVREKL